MPITENRISYSILDEENSENVTYDGLLRDAYQMHFSKIPISTMFLQSVSIPSISIDVASQPSRLVDIRQIGEKITYQPFVVSFFIDKYIKSLYEIHSWMKRITVNGINQNEVDNPIITIGKKSKINFYNVWPASITDINFRSTNVDSEYIEASITFNYDFLEIVVG
jgi:hypothetical protein